MDRHGELLEGRLEKPLIEYVDCQEPLNRIQSRSTRDIYNHRQVAEIVGAGFELVSGMLDIFVPCVNEMAREAAGGVPASFRSRRLFELLPGHGELLQEPRYQESGYYRVMLVLDYVSGMSDSYAVSLYQKLKGISL